MRIFTLNTKNIFLSIIVLSNILILPLVCAENENQAAVGSVQWADELTNYIHDIHTGQVQADKIYLENQRKIVDGLLEKDSKNPVYLFLRGRLIRIGLKVYSNDNKEKFKVLGVFDSDPYVINERKLLYQSYDDALKFDTDDSAMKLTRKMLATIDRDFGASVDTRVLASRKQLLFPPPDGVDFYYNIYSNIVSDYMGDHRYDEAINVLDEMLQKLPERQAEIEQARSDILSRKLKYETELSDNSIKESAETEQPKLQNTDANANDVATESATDQTPLDAQTMINNQPPWIWYALLIGLGVVVSGALYLRRKK